MYGILTKELAIREIRIDEAADSPMRSFDFIMPFKVTDSYFYQTNTALYPVKSENSPTTADDRWLLRKQKVDWLL